MNNKKGSIHFLSLALIILIIVGVIFNIRNQNSMLSKSKSIDQDSVSSNNDSLNLNHKKEGFKKYTNNYLGYGFYYPDELSLIGGDGKDENGDFSITITDLEGDIEFVILPLGSPMFESGWEKNPLAGTCDADGPTGSIYCEGATIEEFTNSQGFGGYKISRTKIITGQPGEQYFAGNFSETVYVFQLPEFRQGRGITDYAGIVIQAPRPSSKNQQAVDQIADLVFSL